MRYLWMCLLLVGCTDPSKTVMTANRYAHTMCFYSSVKTQRDKVGVIDQEYAKEMCNRIMEKLK